MTKIINRRAFLALGGTGVAVGLAGCTSSGESNENPDSGDGNGSGDGDSTDTPAPKNAAIESVEIGAKELTVSLVSEADVDTLTLLNPDGSKRDSVSVSAAASSTSLAYFDTYEEYAYTAGDYTVAAVAGEEVVQEKTVTLQPELAVTAIDGSKYGSAQLTIENTGTSTAWIRDGHISGGTQEPSDNHTLTPAVSGYTDDDYAIAPSDSQIFNDQVDPFHYSPKSDEYDEYCTGEGDFAHDLTIVVEDAALGTVSGEVSVALTGEKQEPSWNTYSCSSLETEGLPVTLSPSE